MKAFANCNRLERATKVDSQPIYILLVENNRKEAELLQEPLVEVSINQWQVIKVTRFSKAFECASRCDSKQCETRFAGLVDSS